mgnify:CR=1 FL=1
MFREVDVPRAAIAERPQQPIGPRAADAGRTVPRLADRAAGDQLAVIAVDFLTADPEASSIAEATRILTELRRSLP